MQSEARPHIPQHSVPYLHQHWNHHNMVSQRSDMPYLPADRHSVLCERKILSALGSLPPKRSFWTILYPWQPHCLRSRNLCNECQADRTLPVLYHFHHLRHATPYIQYLPFGKVPEHSVQRNHPRNLRASA